MSLKIDQKLDENTLTESKPRIFATGAFLVPMEKIKNGINGTFGLLMKLSMILTTTMELFVHPIYTHIVRTIYYNHS